MLKLNSKVVTILAVAVFAASLMLAFLFSSYELAVSGILIIILLTAFIPGWQSTLIAGVGGMVTLTGLALYFKKEETEIIRELLSQIYSLLVILFVVIIVFFLKRLQQRIDYEKTHMASLFENATEGILLTDKTGRIVLVNPSAEKMFGYSHKELQGERIEKLIPMRMHEKHVILREGFYQHPSNRSMGTGRDLFAARKDGSEFPVEVSLSYYKQRNESFVIGFIVDIT